MRSRTPIVPVRSAQRGFRGSSPRRPRTTPGRTLRAAARGTPGGDGEDPGPDADLLRRRNADLARQNKKLQDTIASLQRELKGKDRYLASLDNEVVEVKLQQAEMQASVDLAKRKLKRETDDMRREVFETREQCIIDIQDMKQKCKESYEERESAKATALRMEKEVRVHPCVCAQHLRLLLTVVARAKSYFFSVQLVQ